MAGLDGRRYVKGVWVMRSDGRFGVVGIIFGGVFVRNLGGG